MMVVGVVAADGVPLMAVLPQSLVYLLFKLYPVCVFWL